MQKRRERRLKPRVREFRCPTVAAMIECGMRNRRQLWLTLLVAATLPACNNHGGGPTAEATPIPEPVAKTNTLETRRLGSAIDADEQSPDAARGAAGRKKEGEEEGRGGGRGGGGKKGGWGFGRVRSGSWRRGWQRPVAGRR